MPDTGTFLSRDLWEGNELQPTTFNGWSYVEGNPVNRTDPTGMYAHFSSGQVKGIQSILTPWLFDSARRHNMSNTNLGNGAFAALIVTIIRMETNLIALKWADDPDAPQRASSLALLRTQVRTTLEDDFGTIFGDKSMGPGNLKESTVWAITHGLVRSTNTWDEESTPREYFNFCVDYNLKPLPGGLLNFKWTDPDRIYDQTVARLKWQNLEYTVDLIGANIQQAAIYAEMKNPDEKLGVFNFLMWHNGGVVLDEEINTTQSGSGHRNRFSAASIADQVFPEAVDIVREGVGGAEGYIGPLFGYTLGEAYHKLR